MCLCCLIFVGGFASGVLVQTKSVVRSRFVGSTYLLTAWRENNSTSLYDGLLLKIGPTTNLANFPVGLTSWDEILILKRFRKDASRLEDLFDIPFSSFGKRKKLIHVESAKQNEHKGS